MSSVAFDTNVLIYSMSSSICSNADPEMMDKIEASKAIVEAASTFYVSPIVAIEFLPYVEDGQAAELLLSRCHELRADMEVIAKAADILKKARKDPQRCPNCFVPHGARKCAKCERKTKAKDLMHDAILVAGVALNDPPISVLYSYDEDIRLLAKQCEGFRVRIESPRRDSIATDNGPLFQAASK